MIRDRLVDIGRWGSEHLKEALDGIHLLVELIYGVMESIYVSTLLYRDTHSRHDALRMYILAEKLAINSSEAFLFQGN